ncbi:MAG TPA: cell division protein ZipA C-terminal FtsZ-binding domain-containing protein, partial [Usitatibacteraceae bacterium]|nr:cell division protein ZipA C-terminal FtsZ-binding domain-containing protein [Usitatibacteraceae bacterium]
MSDFQLALAGAAILIAVVVMGYNHWQESRHKKKIESAFSGEHADVLMGARIEPKIGNVAPVGDDIEAGKLAPVVEQPVTPVAPKGLDHPSIHGQIDSVALVLADRPMGVDEIWQGIESSRQLGSFVRWEGLVNGVWVPIDDNTDDDLAFRELRAGLQLASRAGPVDATLARAFDEMVAAFAGSIGAVSQREDVAALLERARKVDNLCAETDIEIVVHLTGKNGVTFANTKVRGLAEASGLSLCDSGEYALRDATGHLLFGLRNQNSNEPPSIRDAGPYLTGLTFSLDVPRTIDPIGTFERMMGMAMKFADALGAEIIDDNQRPLTAKDRKLIADTIAGIVQQMDA